MMDDADHPLRYELVNELHARPSPRLEAPCTAVFLAIKEPLDAANRDRGRDVEHLAQLCARHGAPRPDPQAGHYKANLGRYKLRWESHTEFVTAMAAALVAAPASAGRVSTAARASTPAERIGGRPDDITSCASTCAATGAA